MKRLLFLLIPLSIFAYKVDIFSWKRNYTFYNFLKDNHLPLSIYFNLNPRVKREVRHIAVGEDVFILKENNKIKQVLLPITPTKQLQIIKKNNKFITKIVPIIFDTTQKRVSIVVNHYLGYDVYKATGSMLVTRKLISIFKNRINFKKLPKFTKIDLVYTQKSRFGKIRSVKILYASVSNKFYKYTAFLNPYDGRYYDEKGRSLRGMFLSAPLHYRKITSRFGMRLHPILHKWRMHEGIDYVARVGTPIHSVADGKVIFKGWLGGYGKAVKIRHRNGYITLYAHLRGWPRGIYVGKWVRRGQVIGYLGNTGLSTGPHLHFGVMRYGRWINPLKIIKYAKITLWGRARKKYLSYIRKFIKDYHIALK